MTNTPLTTDQLKQLTANLKQERVAQRKQGGAQLSYLETWDVKASLIRLFGFGGFDAEALECEIVSIEDNVPKTTGYGKEKREVPIEYTQDGRQKFGTYNFRVTARVQVRLHIKQLGATYTEWAASSQTGPDLGEVTDFAIKTAESDALKRAAIYLGTQFGLSLYNNGDLLDVVKVVLAPGQEWRRGQRYVPAEMEAVKALAAGEHPPAASSVEHIRHEGVTDEQHEQNVALLNRALSAKEQQAAAEYQQHVADDVPMALDPSYDEQRDERLANAAIQESQNQ
jgi:recombination DNA repair RAD52 pathway protein